MKCVFASTRGLLLPQWLLVPIGCQLVARTLQLHVRLRLLITASADSPLTPSFLFSSCQLPACISMSPIFNELLAEEINQLQVYACGKA